VSFMTHCQSEAVCQQGLQHEIRGGRGCSGGDFGDHVEHVGLKPVGTAGNHVLGNTICLLDEVEHGRVAVYVSSVTYHAAEVLHEPAPGGACMNVRDIEFGLLGKSGQDCQQGKRGNSFQI
jgi:hypothetical protein